MTIFFLHIPKTAGTSFRSFLRCIITAHDKTCLPIINNSYVDYKTFARKVASFSTQYDLICGHYPYYLCKELPETTKIVTVLRDPLERCVSHIKHQIRVDLGDENNIDTVTDVNQYITSPNLRHRVFLKTIRNLTVKYLSCCGDPNEIYLDSDLSLDKAIKNCQNIMFGFSDDLENFQKKLVDDLFPGTEIEYRTYCKNISNENFSVENLTARNRSFLEDLNRLDLILYDRLKSGEV